MLMSNNRVTNSKLSEADVARIKGRLRNGQPPRAVARDYEMSAEAVRRIGRGETWGWVEAELHPSGLEVEVTHILADPAIQFEAGRAKQRFLEMMQTDDTIPPAEPCEVRDRAGFFGARNEDSEDKPTGDSNGTAE